MSEHDQPPGVCPVRFCGATLRVLSGPSWGCPVHGIRSPARNAERAEIAAKLRDYAQQFEGTDAPIYATLNRAAELIEQETEE